MTRWKVLGKKWSLIIRRIYSHCVWRDSL